MDNRRLFLAAFISLALVIVWGWFVQPPAVAPVESEPSGRVPIPAEAPAGAPREAQAEAEAAGGSVAEQPIQQTGASSINAEPALPDIVALGERDVSVETDRFSATFSNRGGVLTSFVLKDDLDADDEPLELIRARGSVDAYPFALVDAADDVLFDEALFHVEREGDGPGPTSLTFTFRQAGLAAVKRFLVRPNGVLEVDVEVEGVVDWRVIVGPGLRDLDASQLGNRFLLPSAGYMQSGEVERLNPSKQREDLFLPVGGLRWASLEDNYFLSAIVPEAGLVGVTIRPLRQRLGLDSEQRFISIDEALREGQEDLSEVQQLLLHSAGSQMRFTAFFGSKRYSELSSLPYGLQNTVRWGMFGFLARPLYYGLEWIHQRIPNYGWAIVLMTLIIKLVFFPLTHKGQKSMARMQELSPKIQAIRNRFRPKLKDKRGRPNREAQQQMNEELLGLYKKEGVNPAAGCFPLIIQIPVFFAFFRLLQSAVELRHAPWIGWVKDLAAPDPWYILPVLMLATSMLLQRMTPAPPDPMQRRIIQFMPIMFSVLAVTFPAGLVLYWTTNNLLTMVQQWFYHRSRKQEGGASRGGSGKKSTARGKQ